MRKKVILATVCLVLSGCSSQNLDETHLSSFVEREETSSCAVTDDIFEDKTVLTWVYNDVVLISDDLETEINIQLVTLGKDYIFDFVQIPEEEFESQINRMISNGEGPDIITASVGYSGTIQGTYRAYVNDWLLDLNDYFMTEDGKKLWNSVPEKCWKASSVNGKMLGVSTMLPFSTQSAYYINADLLNEYGISEKEFDGLEINELEKYLAMVDSETCCPLFVRNRSEFTNIDGFYDVPEVCGFQSSSIAFDETTGEIHNVFEDQRAIEWFKLMRKYRLGNYINLNADEEMRTNFFITKLPISAFDKSLEESMKSELIMTFPDAENIVVVPLQNTKPALATYFNSISGIGSDSCNTERALDAFTTVMTNRELSDYLIYGIKDVNYTVDSENHIIQDNYGWIYTMYFGNSFIASPSSKLGTSNPYDEYNALEENLLLGKYFDLADYKDQMDSIQKITNEYKGLLSGDYEDVDQAVEEANKKLKEAGIDDVIIAVNECIQ